MASHLRREIESHTATTAAASMLRTTRSRALLRGAALRLRPACCAGGVLPGRGCVGGAGAWRGVQSGPETPPELPPPVTPPPPAPPPPAPPPLPPASLSSLRDDPELLRTVGLLVGAQLMLNMGVSQVVPANYGGSFYSSDAQLTRLWWVGAYTTRVTIVSERDPETNATSAYLGSILMARGDRIAFLGDAHVAQATALAAFSSDTYALLNASLQHTSTGSGAGIEPYLLMVHCSAARTTVL